MKVLAFDPGVTTGIAQGTLLDGGMIVKCWQDRSTHEDFWNLLNMVQPEHVVTEEFEFRNRARKGLELISREFIGVYVLWGQVHHKFVHRQKPSQVINGYFTDGQLKKENMYIAGKPHAMDAVRHLLYWYTFGYGYQFNKNGYKLGG